MQDNQAIHDVYSVNVRSLALANPANDLTLTKSTTSQDDGKKLVRSASSEMMQILFADSDEDGGDDKGNEVDKREKQADVADNNDGDAEKNIGLASHKPDDASHKLDDVDDTIQLASQNPDDDSHKLDDDSQKLDDVDKEADKREKADVADNNDGDADNNLGLASHKPDDDSHKLDDVDDTIQLASQNPDDDSHKLDDDSQKLDDVDKEADKREKADVADNNDGDVDDTIEDTSQNQVHVYSTPDIMTTPTTGTSVPPSTSCDTATTNNDGDVDDTIEDTSQNQVHVYSTPDIMTTPTTGTSVPPSTSCDTATTEESASSQDSMMVIPETPEDEDDDLGSDDNFDDMLLMMPHDRYAIKVIKKTKVHFRLRRAKPTLWRHEANCFIAMRVFSAIDDSKRIAASGVTWKIGDHICTVLLVACLGYSMEPSRSAKVIDTSVTEIIVRNASHGTSGIKFSQMKKVSTH